MLSVKPGKPTTCTPDAVLSVALLITAMSPGGLNTSVSRRSGETAIRPACGTIPNKLMVEGESTSCVASTMLITGNPPDKEFETKARNLSPLAWWAPEELELLPQATRVTLAATRTAKPIKVFFKPGTPREYEGQRLRCKKRDYSRAPPPKTRAGCSGCERRGAPLHRRQDAKPTLILYSQFNGY